MAKDWSSYSKATKDFGVAISRLAPHSVFAAKDLQNLRLAIDAIAPDLPRGERAHDLPRSRDQDPDFSGVSDPLTARGALHSHLASCIDDPDARLVAHQLVDQLCAAYGGGGGEDDDPASFSERNIRVGEMDPSQGPNKERDPQRQRPGGLGEGRDNSNSQRQVSGRSGENALDAIFRDNPISSDGAMYPAMDRYPAQPRSSEGRRAPVATAETVEQRVNRIVAKITGVPKRTVEAVAERAQAADRQWNDWVDTAKRHSKGDAIAHQMAADQARGSARRGQSGSEALAEILAEAGPPPEQV